MSFLRCSIVITLAVLIGACAGGGDTRQCTTGADCASGFCRADGTCAPVGGPDGGPAIDGAGSPDGDGGTSRCQPDHDGVIERSEVAIAAGRTATFRVATDDVPVDTAGTLTDGGARRWDLSGDLPGDQDVEVVLEPLDGTWFAESFPDATYVTRLSQREELLGVFEATGEALLLRGVVSPSGGASRTELTYDPPVKVLQFPIDNEATWESQSTVSGVASGVSSYYTEHYVSEVDALGELDAPYGTFPVKRVRVELTRTVGATQVTSRSFLFVAECFGTVASISSEDYESDVEFDRAAEVRRLAP